jgi:hypothetical protein
MLQPLTGVTATLRCQIHNWFHNRWLQWPGRHLHLLEQGLPE